MEWQDAVYAAHQAQVPAEFRVENLKWAQVWDALNSTKPLSAPGPSGLRAEYLQMAVKCAGGYRERLERELVGVVKQLISALVPPMTMAR